MRCAKDFRKICNEKIAPEKVPALKFINSGYGLKVYEPLYHTLLPPS